MKRIVGTMLLVGIVSGCVNVDGSPDTGGMRPNYGRGNGPPSVPGVEGPYGTPVPMVGPYNTAPPTNEYAARQMMSANIPMSQVQTNPAGSLMPPGPMGARMPPMPVPPGGILSPPGMPFAPSAPPGSPFGPNGPNGPMGPMGPMGPGGPGGPGGPPMGMNGVPGGGNIRLAGGFANGQDGGVIRANVPPGANLPGAVVQAQFTGTSTVGPLFPAQRTQVFFTKPAGMKVYWTTQTKDGTPSISAFPLETPGRYNFAQSAIYRLKLTHIPGRPGLELYPTLEVVPTSPRTNEFLAHNSVPVDFSDEDFKQVVDRNYIVKVIYLPDPQFQDVAGAGPDEIVSTRLEPGQDPIQEALRRGSILLVMRIGNIDQEAPNSPPLTAPAPGGNAPPVMAPPPGTGVPGLISVPYFGPSTKPGVAAPGLVPAPGLMAPPGMFPPPPGLGAEAERNKPVPPLAPLPPLPGELNNRTNPPLPFGPPDAVKPPVKLEPTPPANKVDSSKLSPIPPLPPLPVTPPAAVEVKTPAKVETTKVPAATVPLTPIPTVPAPTAPAAVLSKIEIKTQAVAPTATPLPAVPQINLPPMPGDPAKTAPGAGAAGTPKASVPAVAVPGIPDLPPLNPELLNGADLPLIPIVAPAPAKK